MLRVEGLRKRFNGRSVVDGLSFEIRPGEIFGLLGPNGAGKTTTLRMILHVFAPDEGTIRFAFSDRGEPQKEIGYLPEERGLFEKARVLETLLYLARLRGRRDGAQLHQEALAWLERLNLGEYADKRIETLSKGMQQKAQFIAAVLHRPKLAILDEPFSALDPVNQDLFLQLIRELRDQGMTVLLSSHQMNLVEALCDRILLIYQGREALSGSLEEIRREYGEEIVRLRVHSDASVLFEDPRVRQMRMEGPWAEIHLHRQTRVNEFLKDLLDRVDVEELSVRRSSLHEIFVQTVGGTEA